MEDSKILEVVDLSVAFPRDDGYQNVVNHVSFSVSRGKTLGIVGESGSGKSVSSLAIMQLLQAPPARITSGKILFDGVDLLSLSEKQMRAYRGKRISMIFQEPMTSLNPVQKCGHQVVEMLRVHEKISKSQARTRVIQLFEEVLLPRPEKIFDSYPHEISGGQKQRVMIAMALVCKPDIVIADEPTTALDVTVQKTILQLLRQLQAKYNMGVIFITHDLGVIAQVADDVMVMYRGDVLEQGPADEILHRPQHPYTKGLLACRPPLDSRPHRLPTVADYLNGTVPDPDDIPPAQPAAANKPSAPVLEVRNLQVTYPLKKNLWGKVLMELKAVDNISFQLFAGETLGLVGESGCGKTTLGRSILRLLNHSGGQVYYHGQLIDTLPASKLRDLRLKMQIVFQDPYSSLNPRISIGEAIIEPLRSHRLYDNDTQRRDKVLELMQQVGLQADWYDRFPHQLSGGQRQRVCIARALVVNPELVVCDESVSALDVSVQAQVLNLLNDLKQRYGFSCIFITHDLSVVKYMADRIMVMRHGQMVELAPSDQLYENPQTEYTQNLIDSIPRL